MEGRRKQKGPAARGHWSVPTPWYLLNSMGFTIGMLVALVIVSAIGVILPQGAPPSIYLSKYGAVFGRLFLLLGFDHLFRVWWYIALWGIVVVSLVVCSLNRLPFLLRSAFGKPLLSNSADYKTYALNASIGCRVSPQRALSEAGSTLKRKGFRLNDGGRGAGDLTSFLAHKGGLGRIGPFVTHMSIVIVLAGGMLASVVGSKHNQPGYGGETFEVPDLSHRKSVSFHLDRLMGSASEADLLQDEMALMDWRNLPDIPEKRIAFKVRVDSFRIETTEDGRIADYKTTATVFDPDSLFTTVIEVNKPLVHKGYYFYQSSYGYASRTVEKVYLLVTDKSGAPVAGRVEAPFYVPTEIPGTPVTVMITGFLADFDYNIDSKTASSRSDEHRNPAVQIEIYREGEKQFDQWLMLRGMGAHPSKDEEYDFRVMGYDPDMYTVLEVRTHPVINVIWTGFGIAVIGVFLSCYVTQRRVWVGAREEGAGASRVYMAAASRKDRESFRREFEGMVSEIRARTESKNDSEVGVKKGKRSAAE